MATTSILNIGLSSAELFYSRLPPKNADYIKVQDWLGHWFAPNRNIFTSNLESDKSLALILSRCNWSGEDIWELPMSQLFEQMLLWGIADYTASRILSDIEEARIMAASKIIAEPADPTGWQERSLAGFLNDWKVKEQLAEKNQKVTNEAAPLVEVIDLESYHQATGADKQQRSCSFTPPLKSIKSENASENPPEQIVADKAKVAIEVIDLTDSGDEREKETPEPGNLCPVTSSTEPNQTTNIKEVTEPVDQQTTNPATPSLKLRRIWIQNNPNGSDKEKYKAWMRSWFDASEMVTKGCKIFEGPMSTWPFDFSRPSIGNLPYDDHHIPRELAFKYVHRLKDRLIQLLGDEALAEESLRCFDEDYTEVQNSTVCIPGGDSAETQGLD